MQIEQNEIEWIAALFPSRQLLKSQLSVELVLCNDERFFGFSPSRLPIETMRCAGAAKGAGTKNFEY